MGLGPRRVVMIVALGRVAIGVLLAVAGTGQWWTLAALLLVVGYASNILDDRLTHRWRINTDANHRLRTNANATLTFCTLCAVVFGGLWSRVVLLLILVWVVTRWLEPRLHGDWLHAARLFPPLVAICLLMGAETTFARAAWGVPYAVSIAVLVIATMCLCYTESDRAHAFINHALREGVD